MEMQQGSRRTFMSLLIASGTQEGQLFHEIHYSHFAVGLFLATPSWQCSEHLLPPNLTLQQTAAQLHR